MALSGVVLLAALLVSLPVKASGWASFGFQRPSRHHAPARALTTAGVPLRPSTRLCINKEDLPDETVRQLAAANQRLKDLEEEYWKSLDAEEIAIERKCASGLACLKVPGMLEKAAEYYTAAADLRCAYDSDGPLNARKEGGWSGRDREETLVLFVLLMFSTAAVWCSCVSILHSHVASDGDTEIMSAPERCDFSLLWVATRPPVSICCWTDCCIFLHPP